MSTLTLDEMTETMYSASDTTLAYIERYGEWLPVQVAVRVIRQHCIEWDDVNDDLAAWGALDGAGQVHTAALFIALGY